MTRNLRRTPPIPARGPEPEPASPADDESSRVVARPDGFYWVADDGHQEFGPFASAADADAAMRAGIETEFEPGETIAEAEAEIGFVEPPPAGDEPAEP